MKKFILVMVLVLTPGLLVAQEMKEGTTTSTLESEEKQESAIEEGKELAEKFIVEPAKVVGETVAENTAPIIDRVTRLLEEKKEEVERKIVEDKEKKKAQEKATTTDDEEKRFSERLRDEAPSLLRVLYSWLLSLIIIIFNVWWLLALVVLMLIRVAWKLFRRWRNGY